MNIVLGVSGGIAAYKVVSLARLLVEAGHEVHVVPTADALRFVGAPTWEAISRNRVTTSVHDEVPEVRHVALGQRADLVVVAPATANTLARMAAGLADDLLGTTLLATRAPVLVAPAMHTEMWQHPATQENVAILRSRGVRFVGPESGRLTGNDSGQGRMSEAETIAERIEELLDDLGAAAPKASSGPAAAESELAAGFDANTHKSADEASDPHALPKEQGDVAVPQDLTGLRILVTGGGTREPIDPVRYLGNRSSGRQGIEVAAAAAARGAKVVLIAANVEDSVLALARHDSVRIVPVVTTSELEQAALAAAGGADVIVMAAAVSDYRVAEVSEQKIRKEDSPGASPTLTLVENPDILVELVRQSHDEQFIVGFAAETAQSDEELLERGRRKLARKGVDLLAVNAVDWNMGFESADNTLQFIDADGEVVRTTSGSKRDTAEALLDIVKGAFDES